MNLYATAVPSFVLRLQILLETAGFLKNISRQGCLFGGNSINGNYSKIGQNVAKIIMGSSLSQ